jgi:hypothetical protein
MEELFALLRHKKVDTDGKLAIKPKEEVKAEIGRSPDHGDALIFRAWFELKKDASLETADNNKISIQLKNQFMERKANFANNSNEIVLTTNKTANSIKSCISKIYFTLQETLISKNHPIQSDKIEDIGHKQSCKKGYERNPSTGRCIKSCSKNMVRSAKTNRCVKRPLTVIDSSDSSNERKKPSRSLKPKHTPIKKKIVVYSSDSDKDIIIKPDDCKEGYERSRTTGRCIKLCPSGMVRNAKTNRCIKKRKPLKVISSDSDDDVVPIGGVINIDNKLYPDSDGDIAF